MNINDRGGGGNGEKIKGPSTGKKSKALLQKINLQGLSPGKENRKAFLGKEKFIKAFQRKTIWRDYYEEKINSFSIFPPPAPNYF